MKKIIFVFLLIITWSPGKAQDSIQWPVFKGKKTFERYVFDHVRMGTYFFHHKCAHFFTALKFTIDKQGFVSSVFLSEGTPAYFSSRMERAVKSTDGTWQPMRVKGRAVDSWPLILLLDVSLKGGCEYKYGRAILSEDERITSLSSAFNFGKSDKQVETPIDSTLMLAPEIWHIPNGCEDLNPTMRKRKGNR